MSDVIDFKDIKNKAREKEVDELENYVFSLYYEVAEGKMTYSQLNNKLIEYVKEHNIPNEKFIDMQKKLIERYGYNVDEIQSKISFITPENNMTTAANLKNKYGASISNPFTYKKTINNAMNQLIVYCEEDEVYIFSERDINLNDNELNEFFVSYKKQIGDKRLKISLSEKIKTFEF